MVPCSLWEKGLFYDKGTLSHARAKGESPRPHSMNYVTEQDSTHYLV